MRYTDYNSDFDETGVGGGLSGGAGSERSKHMIDNNLRIEPAEAKARIDAGEAIILDVMSAGSWKSMSRSIAGAVRIDPEKIGSQFRSLPRDKQVIAYCT